MPPIASKVRNEVSHSDLLVEWMEGPESHRRTPPQVLVDGRVAGDVDTRIHIQPGEHRIQVCQGWTKTREYRCTFHSGRLVVLDYQSGNVPNLLFGVLFIEFLAVREWYHLLLSSTPLATALITVAFFAINAVLIGWFFRWGVPTFMATLKPYTTTADAAANSFLPVTGQSAEDPHQLRTGRLLVDLVMPPQRGIQPPRLKVLVDGKKLGTVDEIFRLPAGTHTVRLNGWFDRSNELSVQVPAGELVKIETEQTYLSLITMSLVVAAVVGAFIAIVAYGYPDWSVPFFIGVVGVVCAGALVFGRLASTMELRLKH